MQTDTELKLELAKAAAAKTQNPKAAVELAAALYRFVVEPTATAGAP